MAALINTLNHDDARATCQLHDNRPDALLEILHEIQARHGWINDKALVTIADALNISRADIHGVVSFYHDFKTEPVPKHHIQICRAEACQAVGADDLALHAEQKIGKPTDGSSVRTHADKSSADFRLSAVYCLGNCALGPALMIDGQLFGRVTPERFDALVSKTHRKPA